MKNVVTFMQSHKIFATTVVGIFLLSATGGYLWAHGGEDHSEDQIETGHSEYPIVQVMRPTQAGSSGNESFEVGGVVHATHSADVYPLKSGNITKLHVNTGDYLQKGAVIATITPEKSDAQIASQISLLRTQIGILQQQKGNVYANADQKIALLKETNQQKKELVVNNDAQIKKDEAEQILPLQNDIDGLKLEKDVVQQQFDADMIALDKQIQVYHDQIAAKTSVNTSSVREVVDATANFLFKDAHRIQSYNGVHGNVRPELVRALPENTYGLAMEFLTFYKRAISSDQSDPELRTEALMWATTIVALSNNASHVPNGSVAGTNGGLQGLADSLNQAIDHASEFVGDTVDSQSEIATLESQKAIKGIELEANQSQIDAKIVALEKQIIALQNNIYNSQEIIEQEIDTDVSIETKDLQLSAQQNAQGYDAQIAEKQAQITALQKQYGWGTTIIAPFSGYITARHVAVGESVNTAKPVVSMVDESQKFIRFYVTEDQFPFIEEGKKITFSSQYHPSVVYETTVSRISKSLREDTKEILIEADITNREDLDRILTNMSVRVQVPFFLRDESVEQVDGSSLYVIPEKALDLAGSSDFVWVVTDTVTSKKLPIEIDFIYNGNAFIRSGLTGKEWIIISSPEVLEPGLEIETELATNQ